MKKWAALISVMLVLMLLATGCSSARQKVLLDNTMNLSYAGAQKDGTHQYTSDVGELTWSSNGTIALNGQPFASISGRSGEFSFDDGRVLTGSVDASGKLKSVTVAPYTQVNSSDYPAIEAALLVYQAESSMIARRNTTTVVTVIIMLALAAAAIFAVKPVLEFLKTRGWVKTDKDRQILLYSRVGGIALAAIALIVIIASVF